jgi:hypothetical protein
LRRKSCGNFWVKAEKLPLYPARQDIFFGLKIDAEQTVRDQKTTLCESTNCLKKDLARGQFALGVVGAVQRPIQNRMVRAA